MVERALKLPTIFILRRETLIGLLSRVLVLNRRLSTVLGLLIALTFLGTAGYVILEDRAWADAFYMTVITISTVGFGEELPLSTRGEFFTIVLIFLGVGSAAYTFTTLADYIVAGELGGALRRERMIRDIGRFRDHFIVCGYGRVGKQVYEGLLHDHVDVVVVDSNPDMVAHFEEAGIAYLIGSAADDELLKQAGIDRARGLSSCLPKDADNVFVVLSARALNPDLVIISRSNLMESGPKLRIAGADQIINPYLITGLRMAAQLIHPTVVEILDVVMQRGDLQLRIEEITVSERSIMVGKTLGDNNVRGETGVNILALRLANGVIQTDIGPLSMVEAGDTMIGLGTPEQLTALAERAADRQNVRRLVSQLTPSVVKCIIECVVECAVHLQGCRLPVVMKPSTYNRKKPKVALLLKQDRLGK